jgi:hypothetical protein
MHVRAALRAGKKNAIHILGAFLSAKNQARAWTAQSFVRR